MTKNVQIDGSAISDWNSFHDIFAAVFGFPGFYGRNMNAWIDCMTCLDDSDAAMTSIYVAAGDVVVIHLSAADQMKRECPEVFDALVECAAFVNYRRIEKGQPAVLALSFHT
jgi:RNAse (barnase) inhibitor barstar